jgi:DNA polymerase III epsilon subunit-like protein/Mor family transcriptional regulator
MFEPITIKLDYSPRDERHSKQVKSVVSRLGKRIGSGLIDRPGIGKNKRRIGSGRVDIPTGGVRGYKKPTGNRRDIDGDGWADEGTTNPVWVGLSSGQDRSRPIIQTQRPRPKINLNNQKIKERKKIRQKIKYGESSLDGKLINRKNGPKWLDGLSNEQISNILVPDSYQTYSQILADGFGVDKETVEKYLESRWGVGKPWLEIDYSENSIKELRQALKSALDESPIFSWAVRNYGSPTYTVMTRKSAETYNNRDAVKPLYEALKKMYPDAPGQPQFAASNHLDFEMVTFNPLNVVDKKSWRTNEPISSSFQKSKLPSDSDTVIDRSISGTILHEWAHWYHSEILLANIESSESKKRSPKSLINPQDSDFAEKVRIALEYNSDNGNMNLHSTKKPLEDSPNEPRTITSYGHVSRKEMFAEGMLAYMHPNEQLKLKAINKKLRQDIETILAGDKGVDAWKDSKANIRREKNILSSGRKNRKLTKLSSGSKAEKPKKPTYPRHPSYGPFLDGADDVFADVENWKEFKEVYDNLEINFFDYETTGLVSDEFRQSSSNGAPVQFGVTKTKGGKEIGRLNIFMNPGEELSDWSRKNLKNKDGESLTDEWLSSQMSIADAHKKLIEFVGPDAIFGVQNAVFDKTVLEDALTSSGIDWRPKGWVDTKVVSDLVIPKWTKENQDAPWTTDGETGEKIPSSSLKALTEYLNIDLGKKHHTADADAAATSELMSKIIDKAIEKNWSNDIFDKNWRDQKTKDKLENHQQKIIDFEQQKNNWISETSPKKSTVPKETEEKEFGFGRLSSGTTSYKGRHESPDASSGAPLHNLANGAIYPEDIYGPNGANLYGGAFPDLAQKAVAVFRKLRNKPDSELTVYRAVPRGKNIKEGDWVTILPEYAKIHGDSWLKDDYEIVTKKVKAKELFNEGNSLLEFGYHSKLSSGKYDGAPTYKGKVWKDRKNELDGPVWPFSYQAKQYPKDGPPGISYFKGVVNESTWVDCLLFRDDSGKLIGILNHYPFALVDPDDPRIVEKRGNINIFIDPKHKSKGIGTKLVGEAVSRYNVDLRRQRYSEEGANFINNYVRKLPENKNKTKLSSGAPERIKDVWNGDRYIQFQTYKNIGIGFTGEYRLRDMPSGKRFVEMKVIDSVDGRLNRVPRDEARTFTEKTISAAIDWLLDRQIQTEAIGSLSRRFILTEEQFKEFLAADIKAAKAKPDPNKKKYPSMKKGFRVDEKELASLSGDKPDNRILVQVPNRFWDDHLSRTDDDFDSPTVRGEFRTETRLNHFELEDLISDADYHIDTAKMIDEEEKFDSHGAEQLMDALIKQGIPIENGKLKLSSGKTNRANRRADKSKLSSGSQPRMNLSDEEKREIIAIASQRTDDFSKSVVAQFRRNGKLSDRQWNALNRATLRRSRLSSGKNTDTEPQFLPIENLTAARDSNTDTNLQTPANWDAASKRRVARKGKGERVGSEIKYPSESILGIIEDYRDTKLTIRQIAKKYNVDRAIVSKVARQYNLPYRNVPMSPLTGAQQANIVDAIKNGMSNMEIAKKFNVSESQVFRLKFISEPGATRESRLNREKARLKKEKEEIIKAFNEGAGAPELARRFNRSEIFVRNLLMADEETRPKVILRRETPQTPIAKIAAEIRAFLTNGGTIKAAAAKFNLTEQQIRSFKQNERLKGMPLRPQSPFAEIATELIAFLENGGTYDAAMEKFNLSRRQIMQFAIRQRNKGNLKARQDKKRKLPDGPSLSSDKTNRAK